MLHHPGWDRRVPELWESLGRLNRGSTVLGKGGWLAKDVFFFCSQCFCCKAGDQARIAELSQNMDCIRSRFKTNYRSFMKASHNEILIAGNSWRFKGCMKGTQRQDWSNAETSLHLQRGIFSLASKKWLKFFQICDGPTGRCVWLHGGALC